MKHLRLYEDLTDTNILKFPSDITFPFYYIIYGNFGKVIHILNLLKESYEAKNTHLDIMYDYNINEKNYENIESTILNLASRSSLDFELYAVMLEYHHSYEDIVSSYSKAELDDHIRWVHKHIRMKFMGELEIENKLNSEKIIVSKFHHNLDKYNL